MKDKEGYAWKGEFGGTGVLPWLIMILGWVIMGLYFVAKEPALIVLGITFLLIFLMLFLLGYFRKGDLLFNGNELIIKKKVGEPVELEVGLLNDSLISDKGLLLKSSASNTQVFLKSPKPDRYGGAIWLRTQFGPPEIPASVWKAFAGPVNHSLIAETEYLRIFEDGSEKPSFDRAFRVDWAEKSWLFPHSSMAVDPQVDSSTGMKIKQAGSPAIGFHPSPHLLPMQKLLASILGSAENDLEKVRMIDLLAIEFGGAIVVGEEKAILAGPNAWDISYQELNA